MVSHPRRISPIQQNNFLEILKVDTTLYLPQFRDRSFETLFEVGFFLIKKFSKGPVYGK